MKMHIPVIFLHGCGYWFIHVEIIDYLWFLTNDFSIICENLEVWFLLEDHPQDHLFSTHYSTQHLVTLNKACIGYIL